MSLPEHIRTARCLLRKPRPADAAGAFAAYAGDVQALRYLHWRPNANFAETEAHVSYSQYRWLKKTAWTYTLLTEGGTCVAGMLELQPKGHRARLGFVLARPLWGQGLMTEAAGALLVHALRMPGLVRIDALCDAENPASARVLEKIGMRCEGRLARYVVHPNVSSSPRDALLYAVVRDGA